jgi:hypothetical protein
MVEIGIRSVDCINISILAMMLHCSFKNVPIGGKCAEEQKISLYYFLQVHVNL